MKTPKNCIVKWQKGTPETRDNIKYGIKTAPNLLSKRNIQYYEKKEDGTLGSENGGLVF